MTAALSACCEPPAAPADTVGGMLERRCRATPAAVAFQEEIGPGQWRAVSWQAFAESVGRLRLALHLAGLGPGDRLALIAPVSLRWESLHHAALGLGVVVVGLDGHDLPDRVATLVEQAGITALASGSPRAVSAISPARLARCKLLLSMEADGQEAGQASGPGLVWQRWADFARRADRDATAAADILGGAGGPLPGLDGSSLATIIFTSGTTGAPKGIAYSHRQVCLAVDAICDAYAFVDARSRLLCWLPLSNLFQRMVNLAALRQGAATFMLEDPRRVMDVVGQVAPDIFIGVPRFYEKLYAGLRDNLARQGPSTRLLVRLATSLGHRLQAGASGGRRPPRWLVTAHGLADRLVLRRVRAVMGARLRCMVSGSAPMPLPLLQELQALGWLVLEGYGLSENILPMAMNRLDDFRLGTVGRPVPGNEIRLDAAGAIQVRGPGVFGGYLGETAAASLDAQGWYATGDLGAIDRDGYLRLTGRSGDLIKTSTGRRIAPAAVEAALCTVQGIDQALLLGAGRKAPAALCTLGTALPTGAAREALRAGLQEQLAAVSVHDRPVVVGLLPEAFSIDRGELTPNLKLRREVIAQRHAALVDALYVALDTGSCTRPDVLLLD